MSCSRDGKEFCINKEIRVASGQHTRYLAAWRLLNVDEPPSIYSLCSSTSTTKSTSCVQDIDRIASHGVEEDELGIVFQRKIFVTHVRNNISAPVTNIASGDLELYIETQEAELFSIFH